jgi:hypothetical protein
MGFLSKFMGNPVPSKADPEVLAPWELVSGENESVWARGLCASGSCCTALAVTSLHQPQIAPIERYPEARAALLAAASTEEAIAVILAYVQPKVEEKGQAGDPVKALDAMDLDVSSSCLFHPVHHSHTDPRAPRRDPARTPFPRPSSGR